MTAASPSETSTQTLPAPAGRRGQSLGRWFFRIKYELPRFRPMLPGLLRQGRVKLNEGRRGIHVRYDVWTRACESGRWTHSKAQCSACGWWCSLVLLQPLEGDKLLQTTDKTSMTKHIFSSSTVLFRRTSALESLDLSALLNLAENPSFAPQCCLKHKSSMMWCFSFLSQENTHTHKHMHARAHTHPTIGKIYLLGPNLHNTATQTYCTLAWTSHVCGNSPCISPGLNQPDHLTLYSSSWYKLLTAVSVLRTPWVS